MDLVALSVPIGLTHDATAIEIDLGFPWGKAWVDRKALEHILKRHGIDALGVQAILTYLVTNPHTYVRVKPLGQFLGTPDPSQTWFKTAFAVSPTEMIPHRPFGDGNTLDDFTGWFVLIFGGTFRNQGLLTTFPLYPPYSHPDDWFGAQAANSEYWVRTHPGFSMTWKQR